MEMIQVKKVDTVYDKLENVYTELESIREVLQLELQKDPSDMKKAYLIQKLGNVQ